MPDIFLTWSNFKAPIDSFGIAAAAAGRGSSRKVRVKAVVLVVVKARREKATRCIGGNGDGETLSTSGKTRLLSDRYLFVQPIDPTLYKIDILLERDQLVLHQR